MKTIMKIGRIVGGAGLLFSLATNQQPLLAIVLRDKMKPKEAEVKASIQ